MMETFFFPPFICATDANSHYTVRDMPMLRRCGSDDEEYLDDVCKQWNNQPKCYFDIDYYEPVCASSPSGEPCDGPSALSITFTQGLGAGQQLSVTQMYFDGPNCQNYLLQDNETGLALTGPLTPAQLAASVFNTLLPGQATLSGNTITFSQTVANGVCRQGCQPQFYLAGGVVIPGLVVNAQCCTATEGFEVLGFETYDEDTPGEPQDGVPDCPEGLARGEARWRFIIYDRPGIAWGGGIGNSCCPQGWDNNPIPDAVFFIGLGTTPDQNCQGSWASNKNSIHLVLRCASDFHDFVQRMITKFALNPNLPLPPACISPSGVFSGAQKYPATATYIPGFVSPDDGITVVDAYQIEVVFSLDALKSVYGENICNVGFCVGFTRSPGGASITVPGIARVSGENVACCPEIEPPQPDPCAEECPPRSFSACQDGPDKLYFHFQMPDSFNNWNASPTHGWTEGTMPWLATVEVKSSECCTPSFEDLVDARHVGVFGSKDEFMQNIIINTNGLPRRFYLQFTFNTPDGPIQLVTNWYERVCCPDELLLFEADYGNGKDCSGNYYGFPTKWLGNRFAYKLRFRVRGSLIRTGFVVEREERNGRVILTRTYDKYRLISEPLPPFMLSKVRRAIAAPNLKINGIDLKFEGELTKLINKGQMTPLNLEFTTKTCINRINCG